MSITSATPAYQLRQCPFTFKRALDGDGHSSATKFPLFRDVCWDPEPETLRVRDWREDAKGMGNRLNVDRSPTVRSRLRSRGHGHTHEQPRNARMESTVQEQAPQREDTARPNPENEQQMKETGGSSGSESRPSKRPRTRAVSLANVVTNNHTRPSTAKAKTKEERKEILMADPDVTNVEPTSVTCRKCGGTISLDKRGEYYLTAWNKHKRVC
ncbi:hypothetical protein GLOTRDRAFT_96516 [Gloeophyllum trabeum ATCC 11539]|uniref:Uncharacterized protein n=1 Tax=Gloeophyllum trabeum (strain ATCC 11539 / FP-39264 / Madison 617) TaxID=670483 RepID=S7PV34_GLOTA|nr:uncharacterized protein GLOTRDRAFT_96516 [Gloeophyllum trabeum ATCC 11539]EPQ51368.1 hypothetical protein GLOTRDRAFT_96516 [Gloeophyllum trabeum ATCC 11539]